MTSSVRWVLTHMRGSSLKRIVGASLVVLAGCSPDTPNGDDSPAVSIPAEAALESMFPVGQEWRFAVDWASPEALNRANYELYQAAIGVCMANRGFDFQQVRYVDDSVLYIYSNPLNALIADEWGYHVPPFLDSIESPTLSASEAEAVDGENGCGRRAFEFVFGDPVISDFFADFNQAVGVVSGEIAGWETTPSGSASIARWSACMRQAGYDYENPEAADTRYSGTPTVTEEELRVRRSDISCDRAAHMTENRSAYERQQLSSWLDENAEFVVKLNDKMVAAERAVASLRELLSAEGANALR